MATLIKTHFKLAKTAIKENRTRSFLTCLGIAIGVASIILILSLMGSISNLVKILIYGHAFMSTRQYGRDRLGAYVCRYRFACHSLWFAIFIFLYCHYSYLSDYNCKNTYFAL